MSEAMMGLGLVASSIPDQVGCALIPGYLKEVILCHRMRWIGLESDPPIMRVHCWEGATKCQLMIFLTWG